MLELFKQVKVIVSLLNAIHLVSNYANFLKDLCMKKRPTNVLMKVFLAANIFSMLSWLVSVKYKDLKSPIISCTIMSIVIERALLDLRASINLLSYYMYW